MQPTGEARSGMAAKDAADFTADLLTDLAEIVRVAGLNQSAAVIGAAIDVVRLESAAAALPHN